MLVQKIAGLSKVLQRRLADPCVQIDAIAGEENRTLVTGIVVLGGIEAAETLDIGT